MAMAIWHTHLIDNVLIDTKQDVNFAGGYLGLMTYDGNVMFNNVTYSITEAPVLSGLEVSGTELERSLRETEFTYNTDKNGKMEFRSVLPLGVKRGTFHPCVDGQMATVIKIYRDWKITGNSDWLIENWCNVKKVLEYAWSTENPYEWDRDHDGVLEGRYVPCGSEGRG